MEGASRLSGGRSEAICPAGRERTCLSTQRPLNGPELPYAARAQGCWPSFQGRVRVSEHSKVWLPGTRASSADASGVGHSHPFATIHGIVIPGPAALFQARAPPPRGADPGIFPYRGRGFGAITQDRWHSGEDMLLTRVLPAWEASAFRIAEPETLIDRRAGAVYNGGARYGVNYLFAPLDVGRSA